MPTVNKIKRHWVPEPSKGKKDPFYASKEWRGLREYHIALNPLCYYCELSGRKKLARIGDHFRPKKFYPELALEPSNIKTCCDYHHYIKNLYERGVGSREQFEQGIPGLLERMKTMQR